MLIKVWLYGYCNRIYTSRQLARAIKEQIPFIWLAGAQQPTFKTLCEFRGHRLEGMIDTIFGEVLFLLVKEEYIDIEDLYIDGSKWEANANKHKLVFAKNAARYKEQVLERINALMAEIKLLEQAENERLGNKDLGVMGEGKSVSVILNSEQVSAQLIHLNDLIEAASADKGMRKAFEKRQKAIKKEGEKLEKYEQQEKILERRNSYSKTDEDASLMKMKDEQLLPGYNVQIGTNNQFVLNYTLSQNASDSVTLKAHMDKMDERLDELSARIEEQGSVEATLSVERVCADAAYGTEENYVIMEKRGQEAYLKYQTWHMEYSGEMPKRRFRRENFAYDQQKDEFTCPDQRKLRYSGEKTEKSTTGYERTIRTYECESCADCPFAQECKKGDGNRTVSFSPKYEAYKDKAREMLDSEEGQQMRSNRSIEVESTFGDIKYNMQHQRFILRGLSKVYIEFGLLAIAHNLRKVYCEKSGIWAEYYAQRARKRA
jgi:hypothetical protein